MSESDIERYLGKRICVKYKKLAKPVTGILETIVANCAIIQSRNGVYGMFPSLMESIEEVPV